MDELLASPDVPQDAKLIVLILKSMGVTQYDPAVVVQLLEFTHRYAVEILSDAMQYAAHAETKSTIDIADLKMAIQARVNTSFTPAPSREVGCGRSVTPRRPQVHDCVWCFFFFFFFF